VTGGKVGRDETARFSEQQIISILKEADAGPFALPSLLAGT